MMNACSKCLNNTWTFKKLPDGYCEATCNMCSNEVIFKGKKKIKEFEVGQPCRNCKTPLILKPTLKRAKQLKKKYYYTAYYYCPNCKRGYYSPRFKVIN